MAQIKCKMCGAKNEVSGNETVVTCEYCGEEQTITKVDDEKKVNLFNRANDARRSCDFESAIRSYEAIVAEYPNDAEAHWGLCLSRYGIEYVEDAKTNKRVPTCHRTLFNSIFNDVDYKAAIENADVVAKRKYQAEAEVIDKIQKDIISIVRKEDPYDIFICYKENDEEGKRTRDSQIGYNIYNELVEKGYKVFFSRITLEGKIGKYEPMIFAALQSAKLMLVIGTKEEYFKATWVKNEWSRFIEFMGQDRDKYLVPCYRDMDAYDLPLELADFQALDIGNFAFKQDLLRNIDKVFNRDKKAKPEEKVSHHSANTSNSSDHVLIDVQLKSENWERAEEYCRTAINKNPQDSLAWLKQGIAVMWRCNTVHNRFQEAIVSFEQALKFCSEDDRDDYISQMRETMDDVFCALLTLYGKQLYDHYSSNDGNFIASGYNHVVRFTNYYFLKGIYDLEFTEEEYKDKGAEYFTYMATKYLAAAKCVHDSILADYNKPYNEGEKPRDFHLNNYNSEVEIVYCILRQIINNDEFHYSSNSAGMVSRAIDYYGKVVDEHVVKESFEHKYSVNFHTWYWAKDKSLTVESVRKLNYQKAKYIAQKDELNAQVTLKPTINQIKEFLEINDSNAEDLYNLIVKAFNMVTSSTKSWLEDEIDLQILMVHEHFNEKYTNMYKNLSAAFETNKDGREYDEVSNLYDDVRRANTIRLREADKLRLNTDCEKLFNEVEKVYFELNPEIAAKIIYSRKKAKYSSNKDILSKTCNDESVSAGEKFNNAIEALKTILDFEDTEAVIDEYTKQRNDYLAAKEAERRAKRKKKIIIISSILSVILALIIFIVLYVTVIEPTNQYNDAMEAFEAKDYDRAELYFELLEDFKDAETQLKMIEAAKQLYKGQYEEAIEIILSVGGSVDVNYDGAGGEVSQATQSFGKSLKPQRVTATAKKDGYQFYGWTLYNYSLSSRDKTYSATITLEASYDPIEYYIDYNLNGGQFSSYSWPTTFYYTDKVEIDNPYREGYTFLGWSVDGSDEYVVDYSFENEFSNKTLVAMWEANTYTITLNPNGGSIDNLTMEVTYGQSYELPTPEKAGYTFENWGIGQKGIWSYAEDKNLYAQYEIITYTITYDNGSYNNPNTRQKYTVIESFTIKNPTKTGYEFLGWTYEGVEEPVKDLSFENHVGNLDLVANWLGNTYTITFEVDEDVEIDYLTLEVQYGEPFELPEPTRYGYTFKYWRRDFSNNEWDKPELWNLLQDITLCDEWTANKYDITYNLDGGKQSYSNYDTYYYRKYGTTIIYSPTKTGHTFLGWTCEGVDEPVINYEIPANTTGPIEFTAHWEANEHNIKFNLNDSEYGETPTVFKYGDELTLGLPEKTGYTFNKWYIDFYKDDGYIDRNRQLQRYANESITLNFDEDIQITASFIANRYKVTYHYLDSVGTYEYTTSQDVWYDTNYYFYNSYLNNKKYNLQGFYTKENGEGEKVLSVTSSSRVDSLEPWTFLEDKDLYAYYTYDVTYISNNGEESITKTFNYGETPENIVPEREGFEFAGWYSDANLTNAIDLSQPLYNVTLYAKWTGELESSKLIYSENVIYGTTETLSGEIILPQYIGGQLITEIAENAFKNQTEITSLVIPNSITTIGKFAFSGCSSVERINSDEVGTLIVPSGCETIQVGTYSGMPKITKVVVGDNVTTIGSGAFNKLDTLTSITLPFVGKTIDDTTDRWMSLGYIFGDDNMTNDNMSYSSSVYKTSGTSLYTSQVKNGSSGWYYYAIPDTLREVIVTKQTNIPANAFRNCDLLENITIPSNVNAIGDYAFADCTNIKRINSDTDGVFNLPHSITSIGAGAFQGCSLVESINSNEAGTLIVPTECESIGADAFNGMILITKAVVGEKVTSIGDGVFEGCVNLEDITLPFVGSKIDDTANKTKTLGHIFGYKGETQGYVLTSEEKGYTSQYQYKSSSYTYSYLYYIPTSLRNVTITVQKNIPAHAFRNCDLLESITIPSDTYAIGSYAFYNCKNLKQFNSTTDGLFNIPQNVDVINGYAFYGCSNATEITLSNNVTSIGEGTFSGCSSVKKFNSTEDLTLVAPVKCESIGIDAFNGMALITKATIGTNVIYIGEGALEGFNALVDVILPFVGSKANDTANKTKTLGHIFGYKGDTSGYTLTSGGYGYTSQYQYKSGSYTYSYKYYIPTTLRNVTITVQKNIPAHAFRNCDLLENINLLVDADTSAEYALDKCVATINNTLTEVTITPWDGVSVATGYASGDGSESNPYIIQNAKELAYFKDQVNSGASYADTYFKLKNDIQLNNKEFGVIGNSLETPFAGHFDGNKFAIKNCTITITTAYAGLFGHLTGNVSNLALKNITVTQTDSEGLSTNLYAGVLAGYATGEIKNVYATGTVTSSAKYTTHVGGLVGYTNGTIENSYANVTVSSTSTNKFAYAGGLVGLLEGTVANSFAYGNVTAKGQSATLSYNGGLVGNVKNATITDSYRYSEQTLIKYTTSGSAYNTDGTPVTLVEFYEAVKSVWDLSVWEFERGYTSLPKFKK